MCPFGGIPFIGLGDFHQISPIIKGQGLTAALKASIKSSQLWQEFKVYTVDYPHRTCEDPEYTTFVDQIGEDYKHPETSLQLISCLNGLNEAQEFLFPPEILNDPFLTIKRAFLMPLNIYVDKFNEKMLHCLPGNLGNLLHHYFLHNDSMITQNHTTALTSSKKTTTSFLTTTQDLNSSPSSITMEYLYTI